MELMGIVVVPARDEERRIRDCLSALAEQTIGRDAFAAIREKNSAERSATRSRCWSTERHDHRRWRSSCPTAALRSASSGTRRRTRTVR